MKQHFETGMVTARQATASRLSAVTDESSVNESRTQLKMYLENADTLNEKMVLLYLTIFDVGGHHEN